MIALQLAAVDLWLTCTCGSLILGTNQNHCSSGTNEGPTIVNLSYASFWPLETSKRHHHPFASSVCAAEVAAPVEICIWMRR